MVEPEDRGQSLAPADYLAQVVDKYRGFGPFAHFLQRTDVADVLAAEEAECALDQLLDLALGKVLNEYDFSQS